MGRGFVVALLAIAGQTCRNDIRCGVPASTRQRNDVVHGQPASLMAVSAALVIGRLNISPLLGGQVIDDDGPFPSFSPGDVRPYDVRVRFPICPRPMFLAKGGGPCGESYAIASTCLATPNDAYSNRAVSAPVPPQSIAMHGAKSSSVMRTIAMFDRARRSRRKVQLSFTEWLVGLHVAERFEPLVVRVAQPAR